MKTQLVKLGLGMMLAVLPMMAATVSAQWTQQEQASSIVVNFGDSVMELPSVVKSIHAVALTQNGTLIGQVASIDPDTKSGAELKGLNVFFVQDGTVVKQAQTMADGSFEIRDFPEGTYSFFAAGNAGFAASGVYVTRQNWGDSTNLLEAMLASSNYRVIQEMLERNVPVQVRQAVANSNQIESTGSAVESSHQVRLVNGRLTGQINSLIGKSQNVDGIEIHLIQYDKPIAQVQTNSLGQFIIPDVEPGIYDFVAAHQGAVVVGRFEAIGNASLMTQVSFRKTVTKLEYALTLTQDPQPQAADDRGGFVQGGQAPGSIEFAGESFGVGGASGGTAGTVGNFSNIPAGGVIRGGRFARGGAGMRRLFFLGTVGGVVGGTVGNPAPQSPVNNN